MPWLVLPMSHPIPGATLQNQRGYTVAHVVPSVTSLPVSAAPSCSRGFFAIASRWVGGPAPPCPGLSHDPPRCGSASGSRELARGRPLFQSSLTRRQQRARPFCFRPSALASLWTEVPPATPGGYGPQRVTDATGPTGTSEKGSEVRPGWAIGTPGPDRH